MAGLLDLLGINGADRQPMQSLPQQPMPQQAATRQSGGMGDFLSALGPAIAMLDPRNQNLGMGLMAARQDQQDRRSARESQNATVQWLRSQGVGGDEANFLARDPAALRAWYGEMRSGNKPDWQFQTIYDDQGREQKAMVDMKTGRFNVVGGSKGGPNGGDEYGLNPQYGIDAQGNPVLLQVGKGGTAIQTKMPEGVRLSKEPIKMDAGTHFVLLDPITRQPVGTVPKENYQEAFDKGAGAEAGKAQGEAMVNLPTDLATAEQAIGELDALIEHPGLSAIVGPVDQYRPSWTMGAQGRDALARFNQAKGRAFLQAFGMLKGGGQITEIEGQKAEQAMARMDRAQGEEEFKQALQDFRDAVKTGMEKMRQRAGITATSGSAPRQPVSIGGYTIEQVD